MSTHDEDRRGAILLELARRELEATLRPGSSGTTLDDPRFREPWLREPGAVFVTLVRAGELRGCVGSLTATRPLSEDVRENAVAAAARDSRFPPLEADELDEIEIEVSLLTAPEPILQASEAEAVRELRPGVDGVVLHRGERRATFLPQVWDSLPDPADFLAHLKRKAGLPPDAWDDAFRLERYRVRKWKESEVRGAAGRASQ